MSDNTRNYLSKLIETYKTCEWKYQTIQDSICDFAREYDFDLAEAFRLLYLIHLGKGYGPKLATIIPEIPREDAISALVDAVSFLDGV